MNSSIRIMTYYTLFEKGYTQLCKIWLLVWIPTTKKKDDNGDDENCESSVNMTLAEAERNVGLIAENCTNEEYTKQRKWIGSLYIW